MVFELHLKTETVEQACSKLVLCCQRDSIVSEIVEQMRLEKKGSALICDGDRLAGIFTERDVLKLLAKRSSMDVPVESVMTANPQVVGVSDSIEKAISLMSQGGYRRLPVVDAEHRPVGMLKVSGILHYLVQHFPNYVYNLPPVPGQPPIHREGA